MVEPGGRRLSRFFVDIGPLRRYPQFRRLWFGYIGSQFGTQLTVVAVAYQVFRLSGSSVDVGAISLAQVPAVLLGAVVGGSLADSMDRRKLLVITQLGGAASSTGLAVNALFPHPQLWLIFVLAAVTSVFTGFDTPTRTATMMSLVGEESYVTVNALRQILQQAGIVAGPALGGVILATFGLSVAYWIDVATYGLAMFAVATLAPVPRSAEPAKAGWRSIAEGFAYLRGRQPIQGCFLADLAATVFGMPTSLFPAVGLLRFHGGARAVGFLYAAPGAGAFLGALSMGWARHLRRLGVAVVILIIAWGAAIAGFGFSRSLALSLVLLAIAGAADVLAAVFRNSIIQMEAPDRLRGRLTAISSALAQTGPRLGNAEAGLVAGLAGTEFSIVSGGLASIAGVLVVAKALPRFAAYRGGHGGRSAVAEMVPDTSGAATEAE